VKFCSNVVAGLICIVVTGCAGVQGNGSEQVLAKGKKFTVSDKSFPYRQLRIEDFQAESLDRGAGNTINHVQARSCISIQTAADTRIKKTGSADQKMYEGILSNVSYTAIFEPYCSWWNPKVAENRLPYVLEHEQIHFALTELSARKLNQKVQQTFKPEKVYGTTAQEVEDRLRQKVRLASKRAIAMSNDDHSAFDKQTSFIYNPKKQAIWLDNVNRQLAEMAVYK